MRNIAKAVIAAGFFCWAVFATGPSMAQDFSHRHSQFSTLLPLRRRLLSLRWQMRRQSAA